MAYVKWVANANRHQDWVTELQDEDGNVIRMGVPVELSAERKKQLEAEGRIFEDSSKEEADKAQQTAQTTPVGSDTAVSGPVFAQETGFNQTSDDSEQKSSKNRDK